MFTGLLIPLMVMCIIVAKAQRNMELDDEDDEGLPFSQKEFAEAAKYDFTQIHVNTPSKDDIDDDYEDDVSTTSNTLDDSDPSSKIHLWNDGIIPYKISRRFNKTERFLIVVAVHAIQVSSCIQFVPYNDTSAPYVNIRFNIKEVCSSLVGSVKPNQKLYLGESCFLKGIGRILHEIMHLIGIGHEHSRPDRDKNIEYAHNLTILDRANIKPKNFEIREWGHLQDACEDYDLGSIMHYPIEHNNVLLFTPHVGKESIKYGVGQRVFLSDIDVKKVNRMYKCGVIDPEVRRQIRSIENKIKTLFPDLMERCTNCTEGKKELCIKLVNQLLYC